LFHEAGGRWSSTRSAAVGECVAVERPVRWPRLARRVRDAETARRRDSTVKCFAVRRYRPDRPGNAGSRRRRLASITCRCGPRQKLLSPPRPAMAEATLRVRLCDLRGAPPPKGSLQTPTVAPCTTQGGT